MLGPGVNLARVPRGGRNFEYLGEDPCLAARLAAAEVRGVQSEGVVACVKHWADNNQEGPGHNGRLVTSSDVDDRTNAELYFAPFEAAAGAGAGAAMCSYNLVNSTYSCEDPRTLGLLKGRLNFSGWVVSDWGADHGSVASLNAGMDQTMPSGFSPAVAKAIAAGAVRAERVDDALRRILTPLFAVGVFDRADYGNETADVRSAEHDALNARLAAESAVLLENDGILPLDLGGGGKIRAIGVIGDESNVKGGGSGSVWSTHIVTPTEGLVELLSGGWEDRGAPAECGAFEHDRSIQGYDLGPPPYPGHPTANATACCALCAATVDCAFWSWNPGSPGACFPKSAAAAGHYSGPMQGYAAGACPVHPTPPPTPPPPPFGCTEPLGPARIRVCNHSVAYTSCGMGQCDQTGCTTRVTDADIAASVALARRVDVAIVNVAVTSTEGYDRDNLTVSPAQDRLVDAVAAANPNTVVVVRCPGAVLLPWAGRVRAVLVQFLPGEQGGRALAAVLAGRADPGGRLPLSFPRAEAQSWLTGPAQYPGIAQPGTAQPRYVATYTERLRMGYRWFDAVGEVPAYPFGAGLSYATFAVSCPAGNISSAGARCTVRNTARRGGTAVVQLYLTYPDAAGEPPRQLRDFAKVRLAAGEARGVVLRLSERDRSVWSVEAGGWRAVPGAFGVTVGLSSRDPAAQMGRFVVA